MQLNGFNNSLSFLGQPLDKFTELIGDLEASVRDLPEEAPFLKTINLADRPHTLFSFNLGQKSSIRAMFTTLKDILENNQPNNPPTLSANDFQSASSIASNLTNLIQAKLRKVLNDESLDIVISRSSTRSFPFTVLVPCGKCRKEKLISITRDMRANGKTYTNIRTHKYVTHYKNCTN